MDLIERKEAEEAQGESEERYRLLVQLVHDGVLIASADGTIHLANPSMSRMLGVRVEHVNGRNFFDFIEPEFLDHCRDWMRKLMTAGQRARHIDAAFRTAEGHTLPVEVNGVRLARKGQAFAQLVIHDISDRRQAGAEHGHVLGGIEEERDRLKQILEQMPIGVAIVEAPTGRLLFGNAEGERLLGTPLPRLERYMDYTRLGALHEDGTPYEPEEYPGARSLVSGEVIKGEVIKYLRNDGKEAFFSLDSAPIRDSEGNVTLVVVTYIDITERRRADNALRESEERFAKAFRASPDALVISRIQDGIILEANDSFVSLCGYDRDEILGNIASKLGIVDPSVRPRAVAIMKQRGVVRDFEFTMQRKSGEVRSILLSAEPFDLRGEHCWLTIGRDITDRKRIEGERKQVLRQEKAAREDAEAANRMKDEFLATLSHELRTPLTVILGWSSMLTSASLSEPHTRHALEVIEQSAKSQMRLVDDILDTSRIITGQLKLDTRPVEIERVFRDALDVIRPGAEAKSIELRVVVEDHGSIIWGDANRLQQAMWNLLSNAIKFTNEGGRIEATLTRAEHRIEISIHDTGMGIESQFLPYVFDRFRQADSTSTRRYGGLGLGLAIVRHVVEMHGGDVSASSPGKNMGATFRIRFPVASRMHMPAPEQTPARAGVKRRSSA